MTKKKIQYYDFIVLPARGIIDQNTIGAQVRSEKLSGLLNDAHGTLNIQSLIDFFKQSTDFDIQSTQFGEYLVERASIKAESIKVVSRNTEDGPISVRATAEGERVLRAAGYRVLRQQKYRLVEPVGSTALETTDAILSDFRNELYLSDETRAQGPLGEGVTVAIVDTGVDSTHPALAHAVTGGRNLVPGERSENWGPSTTDVHGAHGTHVAGIVAALDPKRRCPDGIAPDTKLRSYRVFGAKSKTIAISSIIIDAIESAVDDGCDIINLSLGGRILKEDGVRDAINYAWDNGVVCVAAAGNSSRKPVTYPAAHPNCIGVTAIGRQSIIPIGSPELAHVDLPRSRLDADVFLAGFSNTGPQIDFAGPGVHIVSTWPGDRIGVSSGTSMAAPAISGYAALALSRNNNILSAKRDKDRATAIFAMLVSRAKPFAFGSFDYEGYGVPQ